MAKVCSSAKFGVLVFKASILIHWGSIAKVGSSAKFGVLVFKGLNSLGGQSRFICQVWCTGIQGIYSQFTGVSIGQSRFICQFWCTGIQGIYALFIGGGPLAKVGSSAKFGVLVFKASILDSLGVHWPK